MRTKKWIGVAVLAMAMAGAGILLAQDAQGPVVNIDPHRHGNLATAQEYIVAAYQKVDQAQQAKADPFGPAPEAGSASTIAWPSLILKLLTAKAGVIDCCCCCNVRFAALWPIVEKFQAPLAACTR